jgi:predicted small secreted protein
MKAILALLLVLNLSACGTVGGALMGAGQDLRNLGGWIVTK